MLNILKDNEITNLKVVIIDEDTAKKKYEEGIKDFEAVYGIENFYADAEAQTNIDIRNVPIGYSFNFAIPQVAINASKAFEKNGIKISPERLLARNLMHEVVHRFVAAQKYLLGIPILTDEDFGDDITKIPTEHDLKGISLMMGGTSYNKELVNNTNVTKEMVKRADKLLPPLSTHFKNYFDKTKFPMPHKVFIEKQKSLLRDN